MRAGIFGGSFNPIHMGHLVIAELIREAAKLDIVFFIPVGEPSHRENNLASGVHRLNMVNIAIKDNFYFKALDIEIKSNVRNYSIDTLKQLKKIYPDYEFSEIIGEDSAEYIDKWKNYEELLEMTNFYIFKRKGYNYSQKYKNMTLIETPYIEISATEIRKRIEEKRTIKYLVPLEVEEYIKNNNLYKI